jgi:AcrR family transcriptional regulator
VGKSSVRLGGVGRSGSFVGGRVATRSPEESAVLSSDPAGGGAAPAAGAAAHGYERSGSSTRRRVIEAGARVFADLGFHAATKERIGAAAGFSHQTVRDYFRTKEGLLGAIVADAWRSVLTAMASQRDNSPIGQLLAAYDALDSLARTRPAEARCVLHETKIAGPKGGPLVVEEERAFKQAVEQIITTATGLRGAPAMARAEALVAAMEGLARPHVIASDAPSRFTAAEGRQSFRTLAESMVQPAS